MEKKTKRVLVALRMAGIAGREKLSGIFRYLGHRHTWDITLIRTAAELTRERVEQAIADGFDGFIVSNPDSTDAVAPLATTDIPTIVMDIHDASLTQRTANLVFIRNSGAEIGRSAAAHLLSQGVFRSYAFLHPTPVTEWSERRAAAFAATLRENGFYGHLLHAPEEALALPRPLGVLAANDDTAALLLDACHTKDIALPKEVAVLGIDNDTLLCEHTIPPLSSLQPDFEQEGFLAGRELDRMMNSEPTTRANAHPSSTVIEVGVKQIVRRESTAETSHAGRLVQKAVAFIAAHALDGIGVPDVVAHLQCSRRLADLRFRELQHTTIHDAIIAARLDEVKRRLLATKEPIGEIAAACGFSNANALKNLFKRVVGVPMREWRKQG